MPWTPEYAGLWPDRREAMLLHAALDPPGEAARWFAAWRSGFRDYGDLDFASARLLPMVYHNLGRDRFEHEWLGRMAGLLRNNWARNQVRRARLGALLAALGQARIEVVLLKGAALLAGGFYDTDGVRYMLDVDLLVRRQDHARSQELLRGLGWRRADEPWTPLTHLAHAAPWSGPEGFELDLHEKLLPPPYPLVTAETLLEHARPVRLGAGVAWLPHPTELLMHVLVHGRIYWGVGLMPYLWVADALHLLRKAADAVDWERLLDHGRRYATLFAIREGLGFLHARFGAPVPEAWLARARAEAIPRAQLRPFFRWSSPAPWPSLGEILENVGDDYRCQAEANDEAPTFRGYLAYSAWRVWQSCRHGAIGRRCRRLVKKVLFSGPVGAVRRPDLLARMPYQYAERLWGRGKSK